MPRPLSFTRAMRLVRRADFARVYREGTRARGANVLLVAAPNGLEGTRLGLSVGRSIWKGAVERNRVQRVFREAFRLAYPELPRGLDLILIPAAPKLRPELEETRAELCVLVGRALAKRAEREARERAAPPAAADAEPGAPRARGPGALPR